MAAATAAPPDLNHAVEIAPRVWWVGAVLDDDAFQCHVYLVENGSNSVLVDPGSPLTLPETLRKVQEVVDLDDIRWLVCHHADPDVAAALPELDSRITRADAMVVTEWRAAALLKHYGARFPHYLVEDHDWSVDLGDGRRLEFQLTPYLHFPGALVSYEITSHALFSADIFGGFVIDARQLIAADADDAFAVVRPFHEHYMPSRELLSAGLRRVRRRWPAIDLIAPQHGQVIPQRLVGEMFARLEELECGVFQFAESDLDLSHLLQIAETRKRLSDTLLSSRTVGSVMTGIITALQPVLSVDDAALYVRVGNWLRIDRETGIEGRSVPGLPAPGPTRVRVGIPGDPAAELSVRLAAGSAVGPEEALLLEELAEPLRVTVDGLLRSRRQARDRARLRKESERDHLTGALNRRGLERRLPDPPYALVMVDVDHFKDINDTFGHGTGDEVLRDIVAQMSRSLRRADLLARVGGEEFVALLPGSSAAEARTIAERLIRAVAQAETPGGRQEPVTASAGVAVVTEREFRPDRAEELNAGLMHADAALYRAKDAGRNRVELAAEPTGRGPGAGPDAPTLDR